MKHTDTLPKITGNLSIKILDKAGKTIAEHAGKNLIVSAAYNLVTEALAGLPGAKVMRVAAGTNAATPKASDTAITDAYTVYIEKYDYTQAGKIKFTFRFGYSDAVGMKIREFGLLSSDYRLFSRITREAIEKTENTAIVGVWEINFIDNE